MFTWYKNANHCLAYLADVRPLSAGIDAVMYDFNQSEWFRRGWTLQELLAPPRVTFLTREWEVIGHKCSSRTLAGKCAGCCQPFNMTLNQQVAYITGVPEDILWNYEESKTLRPKEKWSWTENRKTTRPEDAAYCLLGIFNVYMPLIYGEGAENASIRLKQEIQNRRRGRIPASQRKPQNEWNIFSSEPSSSPFNNTAFFNTAPRKMSSDCPNTASDVSDKENTATIQEGANPIPDPVWTRPGEHQRSTVERAALAGVSPAQVACAGKYLPQLDLEALSRVTPAQIAAARHTLPDWDLNVLAGLSPAQINATANAGRAKRQRQRRGPG